MTVLGCKPKMNSVYDVPACALTNGKRDGKIFTRQYIVLKQRLNTPLNNEAKSVRCSAEKHKIKSTTGQS